MYLGVVRRAEHWLAEHGRHPLRHASFDDLFAYAATLPLTYATRMATRSGVAAYSRWVGRTEPVWRAITCPKKPIMVCRAIEQPDLTRVLHAARSLGHRQYAAICLLYYAALRVSEAAGLRWSDIRRHTLHVVGKGLQERSPLLHPTLAAALAALPRDDDYVLPGRYPGSHVSTNTITCWVKLAGGIAGLGEELTPHRLRHTSLAQALDQTRDLDAVCEFAGHTDPRVTRGYTRRSQQRRRAIIEAL